MIRLAELVALVDAAFVLLLVARFVFEEASARRRARARLVEDREVAWLEAIPVLDEEPS